MLIPLQQISSKMAVIAQPRYHAAVKALSRHPEVNNVVGHSMGGSVALALGEQYGDLHVTTYGAPVLFGSRVPSDRYRDTLDPISALDLGAKSVGIRMPHSYGRGRRR